MPKASELKAAEETGTVSFEHAGETFTVEKVDDPSVELLEALEENKIVTALKIIMGQDQYDRFKATKPKLSDLQKALGAATGAEAGK